MDTHRVGCLRKPLSKFVNEHTLHADHELLVQLTASTRFRQERTSSSWFFMAWRTTLKVTPGLLLDGLPLEDDVVPIEVAREQWQVLGSRGYRGAA